MPNLMEIGPQTTEKQRDHHSLCIIFNFQILHDFLFHFSHEDSCHKRNKTLSPNLEKIEAVINSLKSERQKRGTKRGAKPSPEQEQEMPHSENAEHVHKKFKYNNFLSSPTRVTPGGQEDRMTSVFPPGSIAASGTIPYLINSQNGASVSLPGLAGFNHVTTSANNGPITDALTTLASAACGELERKSHDLDKNGSQPQVLPGSHDLKHDIQLGLKSESHDQKVNQSDAYNGSETYSPLNLSGGFPVSSTPSNPGASRKPAVPSAKCVRSILKSEESLPLNLTVRSPSSDYR